MQIVQIVIVTVVVEVVPVGRVEMGRERSISSLGGDAECMRTRDLIGAE